MTSGFDFDRAMAAHRERILAARRVPPAGISARAAAAARCRRGQALAVAMCIAVTAWVMALAVWIR